MKTRNFKTRNNNFSKQFDNLTLRDIINPKKDTTYDPPVYTANPESDPKSLIGQMLELPPIIPARFVWHVSHRGYGCVEGRIDLENFSIARRGILREYNHYGPAVFAHNKLVNLSSFYPFCIDGAFEWGSPSHDLTPSSWFQCCGFWRIDTSIFQGKWYIDPNMKDCFENRFGYTSPSNYICTPEDIPVNALTCFQFDIEAYIHDLPELLRQKSAPYLQVKFLRPVSKVNQWIRRFERAA